MVTVPVKRAAPTAAMATVMRSLVAVALSTVKPRMVAPPWKLEAVLVVAPRPVTVASVSASAASPQLPHWTVVALEVRH